MICICQHGQGICHHRNLFFWAQKAWLLKANFLIRGWIFLHAFGQLWCSKAPSVHKGRVEKIQATQPEGNSRKGLVSDSKEVEEVIADTLRLLFIKSGVMIELQFSWKKRWVVSWVHAGFRPGAISVTHFFATYWVPPAWWQQLNMNTHKNTL